MKPLLAFVAVLTLTGPAGAHHMWLEQAHGEVRLYFGEFSANLREVSPGLLDRIVPTATVDTAAKPALTLSKKDNLMILTGSIGPGDSIIAQDVRFPSATEETNGNVVRGVYYPAARFIPDRKVRAPQLPLDVVPGDKPDTFQIFLKGKPLARAQASVKSTAGWSRDVRADESGTLSVTLPWSGLYVIEVIHTDRTPVQRGDEFINETTYATSLSFINANGPAPPPGPPPAKPNMPRKP